MPFDVVALIREEVSFLDIGTGNAPLFVHSPRDVQNLKADKGNLENAFIFLNEPIVSNDKSEISGAYTEEFAIEMLFGMRIPIASKDDYEAQHVNTILMRHLRFQFINRLRNRPEITFSGLKTVDIFQGMKLDVSASGVILFLNIKATTGESVCVTQNETVLPALFGLSAGYCADSEDVLLIAPDVGGIFSGNGVFLWDAASGGDGNYYFDPSSVASGSYQIVWTRDSRTMTATVAVYPVTVVTISPAAVTLDPDTDDIYTLVGGLPLGGTYYVDEVAMTEIDADTFAVGSHIVRYEYSDGNGCPNSATQILTIVDDDPPPLEPDPDYVTVISETYTMVGYEYTTGDNGNILYADVYEEDRNINTNRPVFISLTPSNVPGSGGAALQLILPFVKRGWLGIIATFDHQQNPPLSVQKLWGANMRALARWVRANQVTLGADPDNIMGSGFSAAALAMLLGSVSANDEANPFWSIPVDVENAGQSSAYRAIVTLSGALVSTFRTYINAGDAPCAFKNGTLDNIIPYAEALTTYNEMISDGIASTFHPYAGQGHGITGNLTEILYGGGFYLDGTTPDPGIIVWCAGKIVP